MEPVVIVLEFKSIVFGEQAGAGFLVITDGKAFTTKFEVIEHPLEFV